MIADPRPRRLVILACSTTKRHDPNPIRGRDRYDGKVEHQNVKCERDAQFSGGSARFIW
jgi:hypothetical protein